MPNGGAARIAVLTALAMLAFAANSLLCRLALAGGEIDAASFTAIRVVAGAVTLAVIAAAQGRGRAALKADWRMVLALFGYLIFFAFAYLSLGAANGALILFSSVQLTMFIWALRSGERLPPLGWLGLAMAFGGLVYLVSPGLTAPDPKGAAMMIAAGVSWGVYSLVGRGAADPLAATAANFIYATPLVLIVAAFSLAGLHAAPGAIALAVASGALASGCGYVIWYAALPGLTQARAAMVQLSVPVIAAVGAVLLLAEPATPRLIIASVVTLGGVALALARRGLKPRPSPAGGR